MRKEATNKESMKYAKLFVATHDERTEKEIQVCIERCKRLLLFFGQNLLLVFSLLLSTVRKQSVGINYTSHEHVRGILVLLVLSNEILHVGLRLRELQRRLLQ